MSKMIRIAVLAIALSGCASTAPRVTIMGSAPRLAAPVAFEMRLEEPASDLGQGVVQVDHASVPSQLRRTVQSD